MAMSEAFTVGIVLSAKDMYSSAMKKAERNLGILRKTSTNAADAFEKSMKRFQGIAVAGATVSVVSSQVSKKIEEINRDAIEFSDAMGKIGTVIDITGTKFGSNAAAMEAWRSKGLDVSTRSIYSATELLNDVAYDLMSAGLTADVSMDLLESVAGTAMATIGDLNITSKLYGRIMNTFGKGWDMSALEKGDRIMNALSGAVKKFQWTGDILAESLGWATAAAKGANVSFEETLAALGMLNTRGWEASKAGMAIQTFIREVSKGSKKLGITVADASGQMLPLADILEKIHGKFGDLNLAKQDKLVAAFGARGARLVQILYNEHDALRENTAALKDAGVANQMVESRMNNFAAQVKIIENRWQNLRIELGDRAVPVMMIAKKGVIDLIDVLGEIPGAEAVAGTTLGIVGLIAEVGKAVGPALTMVGVLGMWRTQAALAATAQAALNKEMIAGGAAASSQTMKMGMLGSKGTALVGVLGKVAAVGTAAFVGWEIGTLLRQIPGLDEAVQNLFATLTGADIGKNMEGEFDKANDVIDKLRNNLEVTKEELMWFINFEMAARQKGGYTYEQAKAGLMARGISEEMIEEVTATRSKDIKKSKSAFYATPIGRLMKPEVGAVYKTEEKKTSGAVESATDEVKKASLPKIKPYQIGIKRVDKTGLALIHEGEEIRPKSMAHGGTSTTVHMGGVTINLKSAGSAPLDAHKIKRELEKIYNMEARRSP
ncbi:MAG: phage tail tape measure protein [bacterium]